MRTSTRRALAPLLSRQDGVLHRAQLAGLRLADDLVDHEVRAGRWVRLAPEVVLTTSALPTERQLAVAALLHGGPRSALTGRAACRVLGLRDVPAGGRVDLLLPADLRRSAPPWLRAIRTGAAVPRLRVGGLVLVEPDRALLDACRDGSGLREVRALLLAAVADGRADRGRLVDLLDTGPRRGSAHARRALADAARGAASAPEAELADLVLPLARQRRLEVLLNPELSVQGGLLGRVDLYLPALALGLEVDSRRHHAGVEDLDATLRRHARFAAAGVRLLHLTPRRLRACPDAVLAELRAAVAASWAVPPGLRVRPFAG